MIDNILPIDYSEWLSSLKKKINGTKQKALLSANSEQIKLYHSIGKEILDRQAQSGWGSKVIKQLSTDLKEAFPDMKSFSTRNLKYMKFFAEHSPSCQFGQQSAAQLPWFHIITILTKIKVATEREWYAVEAVHNGWSRAVLEEQIKTNLFARQGSAITNFSERLEVTQATMAQSILKDPYHFDFLGLGNEALEKDIENALVRHITHFLLELGQGFAFMGRQVKLEVQESEFFIDLLFYHVKLKCYVVIELKAGEFKPEHAGQLNFYLTAVDRQIKDESDKPTIGILLCKTKKSLVAEYALSGIDKPMGVAEYQLVKALPEPLDTELPSIEELEAGLSAGIDFGEGE